VYCSHNSSGKAVYRYSVSNRRGGRLITEAMCQVQSLAAAAAANGIEKHIIREDDAKHIVDALEAPVILTSALIIQENL